MLTYAAGDYPFIATNHFRLSESAASWSSADLNRLLPTCDAILALNQALLSDAINCWDDCLLPADSGPEWLLAGENSGLHHCRSFEAASGLAVMGHDHF